MSQLPIFRSCSSITVYANTSPRVVTHVEAGPGPVGYASVLIVDSQGTVIGSSCRSLSEQSSMISSIFLCFKDSVMLQTSSSMLSALLSCAIVTSFPTTVLLSMTKLLVISNTYIQNKDVDIAC
jgi:hypothetical protein